MDGSAGGVTVVAIIGVVAVATIVLAGVFSSKLGVALPLILIVVGVGYSFIPGAPVEVPGEVILIGLLPPILYAAAVNTPVVDFRRNLGPISVLSVVLVVATAVIVGLAISALFPGLDLATGIALGAIVSSTDAVTATALAKRLGLPPRLVTILEGESLVNDATSLVLLRTAVAAAASAVGVGEVVGGFLFAVIGAVVVGWLVGYVTVFARSRIRDPMLDTALSLTVPFLSYLAAEELGASGVLAVVVAGIYSGHRGVTHFTAQTRISQRLNWRTIEFVLENGVFLLMGVQISYLVGSVRGGEVGAAQSVGLGLVVAAIVLGIRFLFIGPLMLGLRRGDAGLEARAERATGILRRIGRRFERARPGWRGDSGRGRERAAKVAERLQADVDQLSTQGLGWRGGVVLGWSGMRGVLTLAAAQSLPAATPYRAQLILIAFTVAVTTLLVQGGTLPWLIRLLGVTGRNGSEDRAEFAALVDELSGAGVAALDDRTLSLPGGEDADPDVVARVRAETIRNAEGARERAEHGTDADGLADSPQRQYRLLRTEVLRAERETLVAARSAGTYSSAVLARAQGMLDLEETRLAQIDGRTGS